MEIEYTLFLVQGHIVYSSVVLCDESEQRYLQLRADCDQFSPLTIYQSKQKTHLFSPPAVMSSTVQ
jgi:hypothetical protein